MATDDYKLDDIERSQEHQTRRRRSGRSKRRRILLLMTLSLIALVILCAPSFLSHSPMGRSLVERAAKSYGIDAQVDSFRVGWITPLAVTGIHLNGTQAGSKITIAQVDTGLTVRDLILKDVTDFGEIVIRGVEVACSMSEGSCSLEDDLQSLLQPTDQPSNSPVGLIDVQDVRVTVTDEITGASWQIAQSNATIDLTAGDTRAKFSGVLTDPHGAGGALQGSIDSSEGNSAVASSATDNHVPIAWQLNIETKSLPLSIAALLHRRFPSESSGLPRDLSGDATGGIRATGYANGDIAASLQSLQIRDLRATEPGIELRSDAKTDPVPRVWTNKLATFNGEVMLVGDRVIGRGLTARADFASATLDGAFSRSITLVGSENNPMQWLEALDGTAQAEIDLAMMDQAMPGLLPLRDGAQLISGRAIAQVNSLPSGTSGIGRRSELTIESDALRARTRGRAVVLDPIEISATVVDDGNRVRAEQFRLTSSFATAVGKGDMRSGGADFQVDFGRLSAILRPIVDLSDTSLGGTARGKINWNASQRDVWQLDGNAEATNLLITLTNGHSLKRNSLNARINAVGRWGGQSLDELSEAKISLTTSGLNLDAALTTAVQRPNSVSPLPLHIDGSGRVETLAELLGPWLPAELHNAEGGFQFHSQGEWSSASGRLNGTHVTLTNPRVAYGDRWFKQPNLEVDFDGEFAWPSGDFESRSLTVVGDALSVAVQGQANADNVNIEVAWRAKLDRIQGSVRKRIAKWGNSNQPPIRSVGFKTGPARETVGTDDWLVTGDCEGNFTIKSDKGLLNIHSSSTGKNVAVVQPPDASARSYTVGPMPRHNTGFDDRFNAAGSSSRVVWSEPNLQIKGLTSYDPKTGRIQADELQIFGDWFATKLTGHALWNETVGDVVMKGPARLKMDEISRRLTTLSGTAIHAQGIHETTLEIHAARDAKGAVAFTVQGNLGWDLGDIAGVQFGGAVVPVRLTETTIEISPSTVPVGQGQVNLAGEVFYRPGPIWLRARPGTVASNLHVTPEMTNRWLKYLAPLAANTANIDGTMSVELDEAIVVIDTPEQSRVKGRINIEGVQMTAGPLAAQIIGGVDQLKALARSAPAKVRDQTELLTMPSQTVEFSLSEGVVQHQRLFFKVDRAEIMTSGTVAMDSRVNLVAQLPLDKEWLGSDLKGLAGQPVSLPITGTLSRPSLDPTGIRDVVTQLGTKAALSAAEETAENYLQKQLNKGFEKIFGR